MKVIPSFDTDSYLSDLEKKQSLGTRSAIIFEADCIGCTLCIQACPVDSILGAAKKMHTVIISECTGCELCLPACPVDCIEMKDIKITEKSFFTEFSEKTKNLVRKRIENRKKRLLQTEENISVKSAQKIKKMTNTALKEYIAAAVLREKKKLNKINF